MESNSEHLDRQKTDTIILLDFMLLSNIKYLFLRFEIHTYNILL